MRWFAACVMGGALVAGCGLGSFDVTETVPKQTVPGTSSAGAAQASVFEMSMAMSASDLPAGSSLVDSVTLSSVTFDVTEPPNGTFDFVQSVTLSILSPANTSLKETKIASGAPKPGARTLRLGPVGGVDLLPYVHAGAVVRAVANGSPPTDSTTFDGQVVLTVHLF